MGDLFPLIFLGGAGYLLWQWYQGNQSGGGASAGSSILPASWFNQAAPAQSVRPSPPTPPVQTPLPASNPPYMQRSPVPSPPVPSSGSGGGFTQARYVNPNAPVYVPPPAWSSGGSGGGGTAPQFQDKSLSPAQAAAVAAGLQSQPGYTPQAPVTGVPGYAKYLGPGQYAYSATPQPGYYSAIIPAGSV